MAKNLKLERTDIAGAAGFFAYSASAAITPVCLLHLSRDLSFSLAEGGGIEAVRTLLILAVLIVSGFAAARWGMAGVLAGGAFIIAAGMAAYAAAPTYSIVLVAMVLVGLGSGVVEALITPLVQQAHPDNSGGHLNFVHAFWSVGVLTSVLVVGELLTRGVSWRILVGVSALVAVGSGFLFLRLTGKKYRASHKVQNTTIKPINHVGDILRKGRFWTFAAAMFFGGGAEAAFHFWSASFIQLNYGGLARAGGIGTAFFAAGMIAGRMLTGRFIKQSGLKILIIVSAVFGIVASSLVFVFSSLAGFYVVLVLAGLSVACFWPSIQSYAADLIEVDPTMLLILLSCAGIPGFGTASWLIGIIGDASGLLTGFAVIPFYFLALGLIIWIDGIVAGRKAIRR